MSTQTRIFFNHTRHKFAIRWFDAAFDVLAFEGEEHLSQPFTYRIEFTCSEQDLSAEKMLNKDASFSLYPPPAKPPYLHPLVGGVVLERWLALGGRGDTRVDQPARLWQSASAMATGADRCRNRRGPRDPVIGRRSAGPGPVAARSQTGRRHAR